MSAPTSQPSWRRRLASVVPLRTLVVATRAWRALFATGFGGLGAFRAFCRFRREYRALRRMTGTTRFELSGRHLLPCLLDRTVETPVEPVYFVQDTWFAGRIAQRRPLSHVDVGSSAKTMALVAQFIPVTMVDIRPVPLTVPGFSFRKGSILALPFADGSVASLSSLCVVEHIGLGRYGDPLDPLGSEKSFRELLRVLAPGGDFYVSVPVDSANRIYFNAHRAFTRDYVLELCAGLELVAEQHLYDYDVVSAYDPARGFGTGMYHFRKP